MATLRRRGVGVREEALLEQLMQDFSHARDEVRPCQQLPRSTALPLVHCTRARLLLMYDVLYTCGVDWWFK